MDLQTKDEMLANNASEFEAVEAEKLGKLLRPGLKVGRKNGRVLTSSGDKTLLGLYRTIRGTVTFGVDPASSGLSSYTVIGIYRHNEQAFAQPVQEAASVEKAIELACKGLGCAQSAVRVVSVIPGSVRDLWTDDKEFDRTGVSYE